MPLSGPPKEKQKATANDVKASAKVGNALMNHYLQYGSFSEKNVSEQKKTTLHSG